MDFKCFNFSNTSDGAVKSQIMAKPELADELQKPIIRTLEKRQVHSICGVDLVDIQLISKFNKRTYFLLSY